MESLFSLPTRPTLVLIPVIGGMPEPVDERSLLHRREASVGLYRVLEEANSTALSVSRIAGDSVLFFRQGEPPDASVLMAQVLKMYGSFVNRWHECLPCAGEGCPCVSCRLTDRPTLRFIAHYGQIGGQRFRGVAKLFGLDYLKAFRLLDHTASGEEHLLVSEALFRASPHRCFWDSVLPANRAAQEALFDLGSVSYYTIPLEGSASPWPIAQMTMKCYVAA